MISQELIDSRLQVILSRIGKKVTNSALFREELGADCPSDEEILAEDAIYLAEESAKAQSIQTEKQKESAYLAWVSQGFDTGLGYKIRVADADQVAFDKIDGQLNRKGVPLTYIIKIEAMDGTIKALTYAQFKMIMVAYGDYCYNSWKASKGIQ
jgi:hypothetical protein